MKVLQLANEIHAAFEAALVSYLVDNPDVQMEEPEYQDFQQNDYLPSITWERFDQPGKKLVLYFDDDQREESGEDFLWIEAQVHDPILRDVGRVEVSLNSVTSVDELKEGVKTLFEAAMTEASAPSWEFSEEELIAIGIGEDLKKVFIQYVNGEVSFEEMIFAINDSVDDLYLVATDQYDIAVGVELEIDSEEEQLQTPIESGQTEEETKLSGGWETLD